MCTPRGDQIRKAPLYCLFGFTLNITFLTRLSGSKAQNPSTAIQEGADLSGEQLYEGMVGRRERTNWEDVSNKVGHVTRSKSGKVDSAHSVQLFQVFRHTSNERVAVVLLVGQVGELMILCGSEGEKFKYKDGPFFQSLDCALAKLHVEWQAYHGGTFVGNHVHKLVQVNKEWNRVYV